jgi:hypothetical protein
MYEIIVGFMWNSFLADLRKLFFNKIEIQMNIFFIQNRYQNHIPLKYQKF